MTKNVDIQEADFDPGALLERLTAGRRDIGAVASFIGLVRDLGGSDAVHALTLEHYPAMTRKALEDLHAQACQRFDLQGAIIVHRVGRLLPGDRIVFVAAAAAHRQAAFDGAAFLMDTLKTTAPFWKKEERPEGAAWVEARSSDEDAAARWAEGR